MPWPSPAYSKTKVRAAGKKYAKEMSERSGAMLRPGHILPEEYAIIVNWRTSHGAVLVAGKMPDHVRQAFQNYFNDTKNFITLLGEAMLKVCDRK